MMDKICARRREDMPDVLDRLCQQDNPVQQLVIDQRIDRHLSLRIFSAHTDTGKGGRRFGGFGGSEGSEGSEQARAGTRIIKETTGMGSMFQGRQDKLIAVCVAGIDEYAQTTYIDAM